jgi:CheY-like chemotaxis protein
VSEAARKTNGKEILIVDDSRARSEQIRDHLMKLGLGNVSLAEDPSQAMNSIKKGAFDLIIVDHERGLELARLLKEQNEELVSEFRARTKLLFTSPNPTPEDLEFADKCILLRDAERVPLKRAEDLDTLGAVVDFSFNRDDYKSYREDRESLLERLEDRSD